MLFVAFYDLDGVVKHILSRDEAASRDGAHLSRLLIQIAKPTHYRNRPLTVEVEGGEGGDELLGFEGDGDDQIGRAHV